MTLDEIAVRDQERSTTTGTETRTQSLPYTSPKLTFLGTVGELTLGAAGTTDDGTLLFDA